MGNVEAPDQAAAAQAAAAAAAAAAAEHAARTSYGKLIAYLSARTHDVAAAEDALADAFARALQHWPRNGVPKVPEAWLLTVARRKLIDAFRTHKAQAGAAAQEALLAELLQAHDDPAGTHADDAPSGAALWPAPADDRLALLFVCAHPSIDASVRAPLMLQTVLGFDAAAIASAFLAAPATMSQRLVRAKRKIREARIPFQVPATDQLAPRLHTVLDAIYAAYADGWVDAVGGDSRRRNLADEAIWLGRLVTQLLPREAEALGLYALMLYAHARRAARRNSDGDYVPLAEQDTQYWDNALIDEAETLLTAAGALNSPGRFQLEAAVQSAHVARRRSGRTDWSAIEQLYVALLTLTHSPVVAINHAVALAHTRGAASALNALNSLHSDERMTNYQPYWAARADLLAQVGDLQQASTAFDRAIGLEHDAAVRAFLLKRKNSLRFS